jgi:hypothetical protein
MNIGFISNSSVTKILTKILSLLNLKLRGGYAAEMLFFLEKKKNHFIKSMVYLCKYNGTLYGIVRTKMNIGFISNSSVTKIVTKIISVLNHKLRGRHAAEKFFLLEKKK